MDSKRLLQELEVHQVELELHNEELLRAQKELGSSRNEYFNLFDSSPVGYVTTNSKGLISRINQAAYEMLGSPRKALAGMPFSRQIHPEDHSEYYSCLKNITQQRAKCFCELRMREESGSPIYVRMEIKADRNRTDGSLFWHFAMIDITKQKQTEAELKGAREELERRVEELQEFAFIASHDLSEPLRKIQAFGSLLRTRVAKLLSETEMEMLSRMTGGADRKQKLLDSLLRYARVENRWQKLATVELCDIVRDVKNDLELALQNAGGHIEEDSLPQVTGDPDQLRQLFQNIISNALKFHRPDVLPVIKIHATSRVNRTKS
jgi:PAS domain S-box-containing protein